MREAERSLSPSVLHRVFYGPSELRAGWRLLPLGKNSDDVTGDDFAGGDCIAGC